MFSLAYSGQCEGGLVTKDCRCAVTASENVEDFADMIMTLSRSGNVTSVFLRNMDKMPAFGHDSTADMLGLRESMLFAKPIRDAGEEFIAQALGGKPYLAAHLRRTDFPTYARKATTPPLFDAFEQLIVVTEENDIRQVYLATDDTTEVRNELRRFANKTGSSEGPLVLGSAAVLMSDDWPSLELDHDGERALLDMWIAARAHFFIGTKESRYTSHIQLERNWLGKQLHTSEREFCPNFTPKEQCKSPYLHRHIGRKGSQHREHWEL